MMSWLFGAAPRASGLDPLDDRYYREGTTFLSRSGVRVDASAAMRASAVYRCVSILANILAMFPKGMYERLDRGRRASPEHPLDSIISFRPNRHQNAFVFWRQVCYHLVLRQNAFVQIVPGPSGRGWVGELIPLNPDRVRGPEEMPDGSMRYEYLPPNGGQRIVMMGNIDIWHLQGLSADGLRGLSMLDIATDTIGLSLAAEHHASRFFERGVKPLGILQHEKTLKPETARAMSDSFSRVYGGEEGTGRIPVLWEGMKFNSVMMTLKDAEFLESRKFGVAEIARWFGVPPHMVGDVERSTSWGTGIEQQGLHFLIYSLLPWIELIEQSIRFSLVVQSDRYYPKFNVNAILRMDAKAQADVFSVLIDKGILNPNECRELLERNPRKGGDKYVEPSGTGTMVAPPPPPAPEPPPPQDPNAPDPNAKARAVARARALDLISEEASHLTRLARQSARAEAWASSAARFYGHFATRVSKAMGCDRAAAKAWCEARRGLTLSEGLSAFDEERNDQAAEMLVALCLNGG